MYLYQQAHQNIHVFYLLIIYLDFHGTVYVIFNFIIVNDLFIYHVLGAMLMLLNLVGNLEYSWHY